jgi:hypothetical protein
MQSIQKKDYSLQDNHPYIKKREIDDNILFVKIKYFIKHIYYYNR